jgi:2-keto-3-deoxy-6-phosphogluconate aldolase
MTLKAAFIFVSEQADPAKHRSHVNTGDVEVTTIAVKNYAQAEAVAKSLLDEGIIAIELCAGFGTEGLARIKQAVENKIAVGAVRFDFHPGLGFKSGDDLFR